MAGKAIRTGAIVVIPELLFYIVTKIGSIIKVGVPPQIGEENKKKNEHI